MCMLYTVQARTQAHTQTNKQPGRQSNRQSDIHNHTRGNISPIVVCRMASNPLTFVKQPSIYLLSNFHAPRTRFKKVYIRSRFGGCSCDFVFVHAVCCICFSLFSVEFQYIQSIDIVFFFSIGIGFPFCNRNLVVFNTFHLFNEIKSTIVCAPY